MTTRTTIINTALAAALIAALAACGGDTSQAEPSASAAATTDAPAASTSAPDATAATTPTTEPPPLTDSTTAPTTVGESEATTPPTTEPEVRQPSPPLIGATDLLVDGVSPLPDVSFPGFVPPEEPGRYHSYRLGTEIVFDVPEPFDLGQHRAGSIAWDLDSERILFFSRWGANEQLSPDEWIDELLASGWEVAESDWPDITGHPVRHLEVEPTSQRQTIGGLTLEGALWFGDGMPKQIWIVGEFDQLPIVIGTSVPDNDWIDFVDGVVGSIELGPTQPDPRFGRAPIEYGAAFWAAEAGASYRTLLFDDAIITFADDADGGIGGQWLGLGVPGEFSGTSRPYVEVGAVGRLVLPDGSPGNADRNGGRPANAAVLRDHMESLAADGFISTPQPLETTATLLGQPTTLVEFEVPDGNEVWPAVSESDGWSALNLYTLEPSHTYRMWTADIGDQAAIVLASADAGNAADLDQAVTYAETVMASFRTD